MGKISLMSFFPKSHCKPSSLTRVCIHVCVCTSVYDQILGISKFLESFGLEREVKCKRRLLCPRLCIEFVKYNIFLTHVNFVLVLFYVPLSGFIVLFSLVYFFYWENREFSERRFLSTASNFFILIPQAKNRIIFYLLFWFVLFHSKLH